MKNKLIEITIIGSVVNVVLCTIKIVFGIIGNSRSLVADGIHSLSDLASDIIVIFGIILGNKPEDMDHNYGHKKIENLSEIILGLILIVTGIMIGCNSASAIYKHEEVHPKLITIIVALISVITKEILYHVTVRIGKEMKSSAVIANAWHHRSDSFSSIAVFIGLLVSYFYKPLHIIDAYMGLVISFIIIKVGFEIALNSTRKIIDTAPSLDIQKKIFSIIEKNEEVLNYHNIKMRYIGNEICIDMHILVNPDYTIKRAHDISEELKKDIISEIEDIYDVNIHIEPEEGFTSQIQD